MSLARWIKYEEDLNAEKGQWGKPHVATLSFKALVNLRLCMEGGTLMLDVTVRDLPELLHRCCKFSLMQKILQKIVFAKFRLNDGTSTNAEFLVIYGFCDQGGGRPKRAFDN